jgi:hypothetical protein
MKNHLWTLGALAALVCVSGCRSDDAVEDVGVVPASAEIDVATPREAALIATDEITEANVDAAFDALVRAIESEPE